MKTIIERLKLARFAALAIVFCLTGSAWAAVTKKAEWVGDFPVSNGSVVTDTKGDITLSTYDAVNVSTARGITLNGKSITLTPKTALSGGVTVVMGYKGATSSTTGTLINLSKTVGSYGTAISANMKGSYGFSLGWGTDYTWGDSHSATISATQPNDGDIHYVTLSYAGNTTTGTIFRFDGANKVQKTGLGSSSFGSVAEITLGGLCDANALSGVEIVYIAVYSGVVTDDEATSTCNAGKTAFAAGSMNPTVDDSNNATFTVTDDAYYYVSSDATYNSITFNVADGKTLELFGAAALTGSNGITVNGGNVKVAVAGQLNGALAGNGTVVYKGNVPSNVTYSSSWDGTVWIKELQGNAARNFDAYGQGTSKVKISGITGYLDSNPTITFSREVVLDDDVYGFALKLGNGNSPADSGDNVNRCAIFKKLSGDGTLTAGGSTGGNGGSTWSIVKIVDSSEFTGTVNCQIESGACLGGVIFCSSEDEAMPGTMSEMFKNNRQRIYISAGRSAANRNVVTIPAGKTWGAAGGIVNAGTLVVDGSVSTTITNTGTAEVFGSVVGTIANSGAGTVTVKEGGKVRLPYTAVETAFTTLEEGSMLYLTGEEGVASAGTMPITFNAGVEATNPNVTIIRRDGGYCAGTWNGTDAYIYNGDIDTTICGSSTIFDLTYTNHIATTKSTVALAYKSGNISYNADNDTRYNNTFDDKTTGAYLGARPYVQNAASYIESNSGAMTIVLVGTMSPKKNTIFLHVGNATNAASTGDSVDKGLILTTTATENEVLVGYNEGNKVTPITTMKVPNAATARHVYAITKEDKTIDAVEKTVFTVYLDGTKWKQLTIDKFVLKDGGIQCGADFGGKVRAAGTYVRAEDNTEETGVINVLRLFGSVLDESDIAKFSAPEEYPYASPYGNSTRTFTADGNWVESSSTPWSDTPAGGVASLSGLPLDGSSLTVTADNASGVTVSVNLDEDKTYEALTLTGDPIAFEFAESKTGKIKATGAITIGAETTIKAGALEVGGATTILDNGKAKLIFDYSDYDASGVTVANPQTTPLVLASMDEQEAGLVTCTVPTTLHRDYSFGYANGGYNLSIVAKQVMLNGTDKDTLAVALGEAVEGDTITLNEDVTVSSLTINNDLTIITGDNTLDAGAITVAAGSLVFPSETVTYTLGENTVVDQSYTGDGVKLINVAQAVASVTTGDTTNYYTDIQSAVIAMLATTGETDTLELLNGTALDFMYQAAFTGNGFYYDGSATVTKAVATYNNRTYGSLATAVAAANAAGATAAVTLNRASADAVSLNVGVTVTEASVGLYTGTLSGVGTLVLAGTRESALNFNNWTGTVVLPAVTSTTYLSNSGFNFNFYGITGSTVRLSEGLSGQWLTNAAVNPAVEIPADKTFTLGSFSSSFANTFAVLKGEGAFVITAKANDANDLANVANWGDNLNYSAYFRLGDVSEFTGSLTTTSDVGIALGASKPGKNTAGGKIYVYTTVTASNDWTAPNGIVLADANATLTVGAGATVTTDPAVSTTVADSYVKEANGVYSVDAKKTVTLVVGDNVSFTGNVASGDKFAPGETFTVSATPDEYYSATIVVTGATENDGTVTVGESDITVTVSATQNKVTVAIPLMITGASLAAVSNEVGTVEYTTSESVAGNLNFTIPAGTTLKVYWNPQGNYILDSKTTIVNVYGENVTVSSTETGLPAPIAAGAQIGDNLYVTFQDAINDASSDESNPSTITLLQAVASETVVTLDKSIVFDANGYAFGGVLKGNGKIRVNTAPTLTYWSPDRFSAVENNEWTGTFIVGWTLSGQMQIGRYGISGSKIEVVNAIPNGYFSIVSDSTSVIGAPSIEPAVYFDNDVTINNGFGGSDSKTTFAKVGMAANKTFTTRGTANNGKGTYYKFTVLEDFDGTIAVNGADHVTIGSVTVPEQPAANTVVVKVAKGDNAILEGYPKAKYPGDQVSLVYSDSIKDDESGYYKAVAGYLHDGLTIAFYASFADVVEYYENNYQDGDAIRVADAEADGVPVGWEITSSGNSQWLTKIQVPITWDVDGVQTVTDVDYGDTPAYIGETPTRTATPQYTYTFAGWTPEVVPATATATYTAQFSETVNQYTLTVPEVPNATATVTVGGEPTDERTFDYGTVVTVTWAPVSSAWKVTSNAQVIELTGNVTAEEPTVAPNEKTFTVVVPDNMTVTVDGVPYTANTEITRTIGTSVTIVYTVAGQFVGETQQQEVEIAGDTVTIGTPDGYVAPVPAVAEVGGVYYTTVDAAIAAAQDGETVTMLADVTLTAPMDVQLGGKAVTLDLGGRTLTGRTNLKSGSLTVQNGTVVGGAQQALNVYGSATPAENYSVLTIAEDVTVTADVYGVCLFGPTFSAKSGYGAVINLAGTVTTTGDGRNGAVFVSGNLGNNVAGDANNIINVTGSITSATDAAIALNGLATVNVAEGAVVVGDTAIAVKRGTLNVTGGTVYATGAKNYDVAAYGNGTEMTGAAISITDTYNKYGPMSVAVSGGVITSDNADALFKKEGAYTNDATMTVTGGEFSSAVPLEYCAEGYIPADNGSGSYGVTHGWVITFVNYDNTVLAEVPTAEGAEPSYTGETPTKAEDDAYTYTFADWTPTIVAATEAVTYTATFTPVPKDVYDVTLTLNSAAIKVGNTTTLTVNISKNGTALNEVAQYSAEKTKWSLVVEDGECASVTKGPTAYYNRITYTLKGLKAGATTLKYQNVDNPSLRFTVELTVNHNLEVSYDSSYSAQKGALVENGLVAFTSIKLDGVEVEDRDAYTFTSEDTSIATVDKTGVTPVGVGFTYVNITLESDPTITLRKAIKVVAAAAKIGDDYYATIADAFTATTDGQTIVLLKDVTESADYSTSDIEVTLDLNGFIWTGASNREYTLRVRKGVVTVTDNSSAHTGAVTYGKDYAFIVDHVAADGVRSQLILNSGTFTGKTSVVQAGTRGGSGANTKYYGGDLVVNGGTFVTVDDTNDEHDTNGHFKYTLNKLDVGSVTVFTPSTITVNGGTFQNFDPANNVAEGAGTNFVPAGYVSLANTPSEGWYTVTGLVTFAVTAPAHTVVTVPGATNNGDGTFTVAPGTVVTIVYTAEEGYVFADNTTVKNVSYTANGGEVAEAEAAVAAVAKINTTPYSSLEAALAAAESGNTVTLLKDCEGTGIFVGKNAGKVITIDFGGFTYTVVTPVGSSGTVNQMLHFEAGNTVTLMNGTIKKGEGATGFEMVMQNYCNLTIDGMEIDGTGIAVATYSDPKYQAYPGWYGTTKPQFNYNGSGTSVIRGSTITLVGDFGIDDTAKVTIEGDVVINANTIATKGTDERYASSTPTITVENGAAFSFDCSAILAEDQKLVEEDGVYTVTGKTYVAQIGTTKYETLVAAVAAANAATGAVTIELLSDLDFSEEAYAGYKWAGSTYNPLTIANDGVTIDLGGNTIRNMGNCALVFGHLLAKDGRIANCAIRNGTLLAGTTGDVRNSYALGIAGVDGMTIENVTTLGGINVYTASTGVVIDGCTVQGTKYYTVCAQCGSQVTIRGTTYTKNTDSTVANKSMFWIQGAGSDSDLVTTGNTTGAFGTSVISIEGGDFTVDTANGGAFYLASGVTPTVSGGTFNIPVPENCCAVGFEPAGEEAPYTVKVKETAAVVTTEVEPGNVVTNAVLELTAEAAEAIIADSGKTLAEALVAEDTNGLKKWENYVLDIDTTEPEDVKAPAVQAAASDTKEEAKLNLSFTPKSTATTGIKVSYKVDTITVDNGVATTNRADTATAAPAVKLDDLEAGKTKYVTVRAVLTSSTGTETEVEVQKVVGVMAVNSTQQNTIVAVPWESFNGTSITANELVYTGNRTAGDTLTVYVPSTGKYKTWTLVDGAWGEVQTYSLDANGNKANDSAGDPADQLIPRGAGVWVYRQNVDEKIYLLGQKPEAETATVTVEKGYNLVAPVVTDSSQTTIAVNEVVPVAEEKVDATANDKVLIPVAGKAPYNLYYNKTLKKWGYDLITVGDNYTVTKEFVEEVSIPTGTGFWYISGANGNKDITIGTESTTQE